MAHAVIEPAFSVLVTRCSNQLNYQAPLGWIFEPPGILCRDSETRKGHSAEL